jgi:G3E family GTPase
LTLDLDRFVFLPQLDPHTVLNTGLFNFERASANRQWLVEPRGTHVPESIEYGISSFIYRCTDRPFHPMRIAELLNLDFSADDEDADSAMQQDEAHPTKMATVKGAPTKSSSSSSSSSASSSSSSSGDASASEFFSDSQLQEARDLLQPAFRAKGLIWLASETTPLVLMQKSGHAYSFDRVTGDDEDDENEENDEDNEDLTKDDEDPTENLRYNLIAFKRIRHGPFSDHSAVFCASSEPSWYSSGRI